MNAGPSPGPINHLILRTEKQDVAFGMKVVVEVVSTIAYAQPYESLSTCNLVQADYRQLTLSQGK